MTNKLSSISPTDISPIHVFRETPAKLIKNSARNVVLDLMRGLAAIAVLIFHISYMLGSFALNINKGYLAVDFFFILSGFVITANYHTTIRKDLTLFAFLSARLARLWPLFLLTTLFGFIIVTTKLNRDFGYFDTEKSFTSLALNSVMLPSFMKTYGIDRLFMFNGASWSVFFELLVNIIFFTFLRNLSLRVLIAISVVLASILCLFGHANGNLDGGWSTATFHIGLARVLFGFTVGMVVYLISKKINFKSNNIITLSTLVCLCLTFFAIGNWITDCLVVIFLYPILLLIASQCKLSDFARPVGGRLGDISYSVYLIQTPAMMLVAGFSQILFGTKIANFAPISGIIFIIAILFISYACWRYFEVPSRNYLRKKLCMPQSRKD